MVDPFVTRTQAALLFVLWLSQVPFSAGCAGTMSARPASESVSGQARVSSHPSKPDSGVGIYHPLERGETLSALSRAYQIPVSTLLRANGISDPTSIPAHTPIFIPGATRAVRVPTSDSSVFAWPLKGRVTSAFSTGGGKRRHQGIDIDGDLGRPIRAAAAGRVLLAGKEGRYGKAVLIDHGAGLSTFYAHASRLMVHTGDWVGQGEPIAEVGRSGNARGTHLHFEARRNGRPFNPLRLLPHAAVLTSSPRAAAR